MNQPATVIVNDTAIGGEAVTLQTAAPKKPGHITDAKGRQLIVRPLNPLEIYRLARAIGPSADTEFARQFAMFAACVRSIDGEPQPFPNTDRDVQAMLQRLDDDGIIAVNKGLATFAEEPAVETSEAAVKN